MATRLFNAIVMFGAALTTPVSVGCGDEVSQPSPASTGGAASGTGTGTGGTGNGGASGRVPGMPTVQDAAVADDAAVDDARAPDAAADDAAPDGPADAGMEAMSTDAAAFTDGTIDVDAAWPTTK
jgi:hypothetical protein